MTEPTRDALHAETLAMLARSEKSWRDSGIQYEDPYDISVADRFAYAAECVQRVPELEAEVASHTAYKLSLLDALGPEVPEDEGRSIPDAIRALRAKAEIVDAMERVKGLRAPYISVDFLNDGDERVWRVTYTPEQPRRKRCVGYGSTLTAAYAAATREGSE